MYLYSYANIILRNLVLVNKESRFLLPFSSRSLFLFQTDDLDAFLLLLLLFSPLLFVCVSVYFIFQFLFLCWWRTKRRIWCILKNHLWIYQKRRIEHTLNTKTKFLKVISQESIHLFHIEDFIGWNNSNK